MQPRLRTMMLSVLMFFNFKQYPIRVCSEVNTCEKVRTLMQEIRITKKSNRTVIKERCIMPDFSQVHNVGAFHGLLGLGFWN